MRYTRFFQVMKRSLIRVLIALWGIAFLAAACLAYAYFVEPTWLRVKHINLSSSPTVRVIHISDIHFSGDTQYLNKVVAIINSIDADFVCFTGDLVEEARFLEGALKVLVKINKPLYGVPGNHDHWASLSFGDIRETFRATGGAWLPDEPVWVPSKKVALVTLAGLKAKIPPDYKRILLDHYPQAAERTATDRFDLILAGHTHGGQVRIPFVPKFVLPYNPEVYEMGLFQTPWGPLYVNPGIGTFFLKLRFQCRPEITIIQL